MNWTTWFCFVVVWLFFRTWTSVFIVMFRSCCFGLYSHMCSSWSPIIHSNKPENSLIKFMSAIGFFFQLLSNILCVLSTDLVIHWIYLCIYLLIYLLIDWFYCTDWLIYPIIDWYIYEFIDWFIYVLIRSLIYP